MSKSILVTGATGKQGGAVIDALANNPEFTLLAQTRNATGAGAQKLQGKGNNIKVVEGDQDNVPGLFANAEKAAEKGIWGVYSVQVSQGKGVTHEGEIKQGKAMIDEAVKAGVKHFVYSSVERGGDEKSWENETPIPHFQSKYEIEHHLKKNAGQMGWTVLRPGKHTIVGLESIGSRLLTPYSGLHGQPSPRLPDPSVHGRHARDPWLQAQPMDRHKGHWHLRQALLREPAKVQPEGLRSGW